MKTLATPQFEQKLQTIDASYRDAFLKILSSVKNSDTNTSANILGLLPIFNPNNIQSYKLGSLRVFLNFTKDNEGNDILLLLDLTLDVAPINSNKNPRYNNLINPRYNNLINPRYNNLINPRYNNLINPRYNPNFNGFYYYDINGTPYEFVIKENNQNMLLFYDFSGEQTKYAVPNSRNGYVVFDLENNFIGHLESDSQSGFNYFDLQENWIGFLK